jgi:hypothetical protein
MSVYGDRGLQVQLRYLSPVKAKEKRTFDKQQVRSRCKPGVNQV